MDIDNTNRNREQLTGGEHAQSIRGASVAELDFDDEVTEPYVLIDNDPTADEIPAVLRQLMVAQ